MAPAETVVRHRRLLDGSADDATAYTALRDECAAFDRSDADFVRVVGSDAEAVLQRVATRDLEYLTPERCTTGLVLQDDGSLVDLVTIYRADDSFLIEASPGSGPRLVEHIAAHAGDDQVDIEDLAGTLVCVAVEGPYAWNAAGRIVAPELAALPLDSVIEATWCDRTIVFSRSGVTGEYGYKFVGDADDIAALAAELAKEVVVADAGVQATAMLEVRHPSLPPGADVGTIVRSGASWLVDPGKDSFVGREAFHATHAAEQAITVGFVTDGEAPVPEGTAVTTADGTDVGAVVTSGWSPRLERTIGLAAIDGALSCVGLELAAGDRGVTTVTSPFIVPKSWKTPIL
jgi:glycine cleavage system aminomethyltransferase T